MTAHQRIQHYVAAGVETVTVLGKKIQVLHNPAEPVLVAAALRKSMRGLVDAKTGDTFWWNAREMIHPVMEKALGLLDPEAQGWRGGKNARVILKGKALDVVDNWKTVAASSSIRALMKPGRLGVQINHRGEHIPFDAWVARTQSDADRISALNRVEAAPQTVRLLDLYDERELSDEGEALYHYVDEDDLTRDFKVRVMTPAQAKTYTTPKDDMTVYEAYKKFAGRDQKRLVREKKTRFDRERIIVVINKTVLDGNHHLIAGILANEPIQYIDLGDFS